MARRGSKSVTIACGTKSVGIACGEDKLSGAAEHPWVRRLRHRRLLAFLWLQGHEGTFGSMVRETDAFLSVVHLQQFIEQGQWRDAIGYLSRFLPSGTGLLSVETEVLNRFLVAHAYLADILAGTQDGDALAAYFSTYHNHDRTVCHGSLRLRSILLTTLYAKEQLRVSLDWEHVRRKASEIVYDLVHSTPELKRVVLLPAGPMKPHTVLPIPFGSRRRCHRKKQPCRPGASALAKRYLRKKGSTLSSSHSQESPHEVTTKAMNWMADVLDETLQVGSCPLQTGRKEGACGILRTTFGTVIEQARNSVASAVSGAGATVAPGSQTMFGSLSGPAKNLRMKSVANAGKLASHVPTSGAPVSQTVFGSSTSHCENSGIALMANAGASVSQTLNLTSHADKSGACN